MNPSQHPANYFYGEYDDDDDYESLHNNHEPVEPEEKSMSSMLSYAKKAVADQTRHSQIFDAEKEASVPTFDYDELLIGKLLGRGGFCDVSEIVEIKLKRDGDMTLEQQQTQNHSHNEFTDRHTRAFIATHVIRQNEETGKEDSRYAVKQLSARVRLDQKKCVQGTVDLALEARFLSVLEHPNIIKMRGVVGGDVFHAKRCFLVLDRLYDTLTERLLKWDKRTKMIQKSFGFLKGGKKKEKKKELLLERVTIAYDLAFAMTYMHSLDMIYRDLKPENIGFDCRGDVKIFDFGLAKELQPSLLVADDLYELTASTGSPRYMAPEVCLGEPYNKKADVYSFSVLLWQILSLEVPYDNYDYSFFYDKVMCGDERPKMVKDWPNRWKDLLSCGWSRDLIDRPTMNETLSILEEEMVELQGYGDTRAISRSEVSTS